MQPKKLTSYKIAPKCPFCGGSSRYIFKNTIWRIQEDSREFRYSECENCEMLFSMPLPSQSEIKYIYEEYYNFEWYIQHRLFKKIQAWHRYKRLRTLFHDRGYKWNKDKLLDVGCGHGWFLQEALKEGWDAFGIDYLEDDLLKKAIVKGIRVKRALLEENTLPRDHFSLITMWHILEHLRNPKLALNIMSELLKNDGYCVIAVPNRDSKGLAKMGVKWEWLQEPFVHMYCFSHKTIKKILPKNLKIVEIISRDTWDQQYAQYTVLFGAYKQLIRYLFRAPRKIALKLNLQIISKICDIAHFISYELSLLICYSIYLILRRFLRKYECSLKGSELMLIIRKNGEY